jgi:hypothetical protein
MSREGSSKSKPPLKLKSPDNNVLEKEVKRLAKIVEMLTS